MPIVVMLNVAFIYCYAECRYAECHYAECRGVFIMTWAPFEKRMKGGQCYKTFDGSAFVSGGPFQPSLIFVGKSSSLSA
jgi:hypothetical protein